MLITILKQLKNSHHHL